MIFTATEQQIKQIAMNAILASKVVGMGIYQDAYYKGVPLTLNDINIEKDGIFIDYFRGRMVKLNILKRDESLWEINDEISLDYQSWGEKYSNVQALVGSVLKTDSYYANSLKKRLGELQQLEKDE